MDDTSTLVQTTPRVIALTIAPNKSATVRLELAHLGIEPMKVRLKNEGEQSFSLVAGKQSKRTDRNENPITIILGDYPKEVHLQGALHGKHEFSKVFNRGVMTAAFRHGKSDTFYLLVYSGHLVDFSPSNGTFGFCGFEALKAAESKDSLTSLSGIHSLAGANQPEACQIPRSIADQELARLSRVQNNEISNAARKHLKRLRASPLFMLKVEDERGKWRYYIAVNRVGRDYSIYQANTFTKDDKDQRSFTAAIRKTSKHLTLTSGEHLQQIAAFSELSFRRPNYTHSLGSVQMADSMTRIFGTTKRKILVSDSATKGKVHFFAYLQSNKRGVLYSFTIDSQTDRVSEVRVNDESAFRRVNAFHTKKLTGKLANAKNLYLDLLKRLDVGAPAAN